MNRWIALLLCLLLLPVGALAQTAERYTSLLPDECLPVREAPCALDEQEAIRIAREELAFRCGFGEDALDGYTCRSIALEMSSGEHVQAVSMFSGAYQPIDAVLLLSPEGEVLRFESTSLGYFRQPQTRWEAVLGPYGRWPLETQALFDHIYSVDILHALPPENGVTEADAFAAAVEAAGLASSITSVTYERALAINPAAESPDEAQVWMITLFIGGDRVAQVNLSATDGHIIDVFIEQESIG